MGRRLPRLRRKMKFKYRLSNVAIKKFSYHEGFYDVYEYSHNEYQIFRKGIFKWKKYLDGIETEEQGLKLLKQLKDAKRGN